MLLDSESFSDFYAEIFSHNWANHFSAYRHEKGFAFIKKNYSDRGRIIMYCFLTKLITHLQTTYSFREHIPNVK